MSNKETERKMMTNDDKMWYINKNFAEFTAFCNAHNGSGNGFVFPDGTLYNDAILQSDPLF